MKKFNSYIIKANVKIVTKLDDIHRELEIPVNSCVDEHDACEVAKAALEHSGFSNVEIIGCIRM